MASLPVFILLCLLFTSTRGQEQNLIEKLIKRIESLELQGIEQRQLIDQQGTLLKRYDEKLRHFEERLKQITEINEQSEKTVYASEAKNETQPASGKETFEAIEVTFPTKRGNSKYHSFQGSQHRQQTRLVVDNIEGPVAFHVTNDKGTTPNIGLNQHILFEDVHLNTGNAFHALHGLFIAPRSGIYIFSTSIMTQVSLGDISASIEVNGVDVARAYANGNSGVPDQGSVTVVVQLMTGDEVWVKSYDRASAAEYGDKFSSFMGCLIMEI